MYKRLIAVPLLVTPLWGCSMLDIYTESGFFQPGSAGGTPVGLENVTASGVVEHTSIGGVQYLTYFDSGFAGAKAGVLADSDVGSVLTAGEAVYSAAYEVAAMNDLQIRRGSGGSDGYHYAGFSNVDSGNIVLTADFGAATIRGEDGRLKVDGTISGGDIGGNVTYGGREGDLEGIIGKFGAIGAFHGNSADMVYAGGFVGFNED